MSLQDIHTLALAIMELQELMPTIMENQNNINKRLEALDAHQMAMVGRIGELEARQDPGKHNDIVEWNEYNERNEPDYEKDRNR